MIERIGWFLEIVNVILCLHFLYGKKINSKAATGLLIAADMFVMEVITVYSANDISVFIIYIMIWVYSVIEFGESIARTLLGNVLWIIIVGIFQLVSSIPWAIVGISVLEDYMITCIQAETLVLMLIIRKKLSKMFTVLFRNNILVTIVLAMFAGYIVVQAGHYRIEGILWVEQFLFFLFFGILICVFSFCWQQERERRQEKELELRLTNLCEPSFRELIDTIRDRQHEFHNHIHTLNCLHYTINTYDELVREQEHYCTEITYDNRFYQLLNSKSPVISGFLYGKILEADKKGIDVRFSVGIKQKDIGLPEYVTVEILGILLDNAIEYVIDKENKNIILNITEESQEKESPVCIVVKNPVVDFSSNEISKFFERGYSKKENHMGLGLNKIKKYAERYPISLSVGKTSQRGLEWIEFSIKIQRGVQNI